MTPFEQGVAKVGCPYLFEYKNELTYKNVRVINGEITPSIEHPWAVRLSLIRHDEHDTLCSGVIISPTYIATAKHCFGKKMQGILRGTVFYSTPTRFEGTFAVYPGPANRSPSPRTNNRQNLNFVNVNFLPDFYQKLLYLISFQA